MRGEVAVRRGDHVVIEAAGMGYRLSVSAQTLRAVPPAGEEAMLLAHLVLRDDGMQLYGFATEEERELFHLLVGVQGVGPKVALAVLSGGPVRELLQAIGRGDAGRFQAVPGIGKRTAERIIVELRERVGGEENVSTGLVNAIPDDPISEARQALATLGYGAREIDVLLDKATGETPEELISEALRAAR